MHLELVPPDHPALRAQAEPVADFGKARVLAVAMARILQQHRGLALAAPQVGHPLQLIVFAGSLGLPYALANPMLAFPDPQEVMLSDEGCLSLPGQRVKVPRYRHVLLTAQWLGGAVYTARLTGLAARVLQHEADHLRGVLITDPRPNGLPLP